MIKRIQVPSFNQLNQPLRAVFNVLGVPYGGKPVEEAFNDITKKRMEDWMSQFPNEQITTRHVLDKVKNAPVTDVFKIIKIFNSCFRGSFRDINTFLCY